MILRDAIIQRHPLLYLSAHAGLDRSKLIRVSNTADEQRYKKLQKCIQKGTPFVCSTGNQSGNAKGWVYWTAMQPLRDNGLHPLAFNLEIYTMSKIKPGGKSYWWCRYNPPESLDDEAAKWCTEKSKHAPVDTKGNRVEFVRATLTYLTLATKTLMDCPFP